jgi:hypothetical protein
MSLTRFSAILSGISTMFMIRRSFVIAAVRADHLSAGHTVIECI